MEGGKLESEIAQKIAPTTCGRLWVDAASDYTILQGILCMKLKLILQSPSSSSLDSEKGEENEKQIN